MNDEQLLRYDRHILLPEIDIAGQAKLQAASATIVGLGGLGCPVALYLAAAGIGKLTLFDHDTVSESNLSRQILFSGANTGELKVAAAKRRLEEMNPDCKVQAVAAKFDENVSFEADVLLDCSDNYATRMSVNSMAFQQNTPLVSGAAIRWQAQISVFDPNQSASPCYACLYPEPLEEAESCTTEGVVSPLVGITGCTQALEAIKLITGAGQSLVGKILHLDALIMEWQKFTLSPRPDCRTCRE